MASITSQTLSTGETRWRSRIRIRGQDNSKTFRRKDHAHKWAQKIEWKLLRAYEIDPHGRYKVIRID